jgi:hypothetical protein
MSPSKREYHSEGKVEPILYSSLPGLRPKDLDEEKARELRALEKSVRKRLARQRRAARRKDKKRRMKDAASRDERGERIDSLSSQSDRKKTQSINTNEPPITPKAKHIRLGTKDQTNHSLCAPYQYPNPPDTPTPVTIKYDDDDSRPYPGSKKSVACDCPTINGLCEHSLLPVGGIYHPVTALKAYGPKGKMLESKLQRTTPMFSLRGRRKSEKQNPPDSLYLEQSSKDEPLSEIHPEKGVADAYMDTLEDVNRRAKEDGSNAVRL